MNLVWFIILVLTLKFTINFSKYIRTKRYLNRYENWIANSGDKGLLESKAQIVKLLKDAGVEDSYIGFAEPVGFMQIRTGNASVFSNIFNRREDVVGSVAGMFYQAVGTYRSRMIETFNPLYWLEAAINLPKHLSSYLGVSPESVLTKVTQLVWWVVVGVMGFLYALYKPELEAVVKNWLNKLSQ